MIRRMEILVVATTVAIAGALTGAVSSSFADEGGNPTVSVSVGAAFENDRSLHGVVRLTMTNDTGETLDSIPLWLYPNRFTKPGPGLSDRTVNWIYPAGKSIGKMEISHPSWNGDELGNNSIEYLPMPNGGTPKDAKNVVALVHLDTPMEPDETGTLEMSFHVKIPQRRGRFGHWRGVVSLAGGWFPRPMTDLTGRDTGLPPEAIEAHVNIQVPAGRGAVIHDRVHPPCSTKQLIEERDIRTDILTLVVMDRMDVTERDFEWGKGVYVSSKIKPHRAQWKDTRGDEKGTPRGIPAMGKIDYADRGLKVLESTAGAMRRLAPGCSMPNRLLMVEIPAWDRLAQTSGGPVLVSDRTWRLVPIERALSFHDIALSRVLGAALAASTVNESDSPMRRYVTAQLVGGLLGDIYADDVHGGMTSVKELVGFAAFIPYVDTLLYAPQVPFRESYSLSAEEPDPLRDRPWKFMNRLPDGRRVLAKLEDLGGKEATTKLVAGYLAGESGFDLAVKELLQERADILYGQWYGDYPSVNYSIVRVTDKPLENGRISHQVTIARDGDDIIEPVTVKIIDENDIAKEVVWDGEGSEGTVEWISEAPVDSVTVDPHHRLVEAPSLTGDHPLKDNLDPLPWRPPLLTRLLIWGDSETYEPYLQISFSMRRLYDVTNSLHLGASYTPRSYSGYVGYLRHFGPKRTLNSRIWYFGPSLSISRNEKTETAGSEIPKDSLFAATMGSASLVLGRDDRSYFFDPRFGTSFNGWISYSGGRADDGHGVNVGSAGARIFGLWTPSFGHTFAAYGGLSTLVGDPPATRLASLSSRMVLRGFATDETYGRLGLYAVTEYRHNIVDASRIGLILSWFDRFQGVFFVGTGTISWPDGYDGLFTKDRSFTEVGYGLRLHLLAFGVSQYLIALDLAVPVAPSVREYEVIQTDGSVVNATRSPFKVVFGITHTY